MGLERFVEAQEGIYHRALAEIRSGQKQSHWMWFIFPQLKGLGSSSVAGYYGIDGIAEATAYIQHEVLGARLVEIANALLEVDGRTASDIFGYPDDVKLCSCMTLFSCVAGAPNVFEGVLKKYFEDIPDSKTLLLLRR